MRNILVKGLVGGIISILLFAGLLGVISFADAGPTEYHDLSTASVWCVNPATGATTTVVTIGQVFTVKAYVYLLTSVGAQSGVYARLTIDGVSWDTSQFTVQPSTKTLISWTNKVVSTVGTHTITVNVNPDKTIGELGKNWRVNAYLNNVMSTTVTATSGPVWINGFVHGINYDRTSGSYGIKGATVTIYEETTPHAYTGISYQTTTTDGQGYYTLALPPARNYNFVATDNDHATVDFHVTALTGGCYNFPVDMRCQWKEGIQPWELDGYGKDTRQWRAFTRDVDGNGIIDSVNLFADTKLLQYWEPPYSDVVTMWTSPPANVTAWIELQGYTWDGVSYTRPQPEYVMPKVWPSGTGCYYTSKMMVMKFKTNVGLNSVVNVPAFPSAGYGAYKLTVQSMEIYSHSPGIAFCLNSPGSYNTALNPFNPITAGPWPQVGAFPAKGDGTDLFQQMNTMNNGYPNGRPNTAAFFQVAQCSLSSFNIPFALSFYGEIFQWLSGTDESGAQREVWYSTWGMGEFGFNVVATPYSGVATSPSPADGAGAVPLTTTLTWVKPSGSNYYWVEFWTPIWGPSVTYTSANSWTVSLSPSVTWSWHVRSSPDGGDSWGPWSATWTFTTVGTYTGVATLLSPANGATGVSLNPTFSWTPPSGSNYYLLQIWADGRGTHTQALLLWRGHWTPA